MERQRAIMVAFATVCLFLVIYNYRDGFANIVYDKPPYTRVQQERDDYSTEAYLRSIVQPGGYSYPGRGYESQQGGYVEYTPDSLSNNSIYSVTLEPRKPVTKSLLTASQGLWLPLQSQSRNEAETIRVEEINSDKHVQFASNNSQIGTVPNSLGRSVTSNLSNAITV